MTGPCRLLEWDTEFFGFKIGRVTEPRPGAAHLRSALEWGEAEQVSCLVLLIDIQHSESIVAAEELGFHLRDIRMTLERPLQNLPPAPLSGVRPCRPEDIPELARIATVNHTDSRFYNDPGFPRERCDALYSLWIEKSCHGYADQVFVAEHLGRPAGYITCHNDADAGRIGLLGVEEAARGRNFGKDLVSAALHYFAETGLSRSTVVTQGRNTAAQRFYGRREFIPQSVELWYHYWRSPQGLA